MTEVEVRAIVQVEIDASDSTSGRAVFDRRRKYLLFGPIQWHIDIRFRGGKKWLRLVIDDVTGEIVCRRES